MSTIAEFAIAADEFLLGGVVADFPDLSIELERIVPLGQRVMPYLWCRTEDPDAFETVLDQHSNVDGYSALDTTSDGVLYRIEWTLVTDLFVEAIWHVDATLLEASADDDWHVRLLFEDRRDVRAFNQHLADNDVAYSLERLYSAYQDASDPMEALTDEQRAALVAAATDGYFRVPRETTMADIARSLGISEQATSERIRRGVDAMLRDALDTDLPRHG